MTPQDDDLNFRLRFKPPQYWEASYTFTNLETAPAAVRIRRACLLDNGFREIPDPNDPSGGSIILEKPYHNILIERHFLNLDGRHQRSLEIIDKGGKRLTALTSDIENATSEARKEDKWRKG